MNNFNFLLYTFDSILREHIVDYLTYKITNNIDFIAPSVLQDWKGIEKTFGLKKIVERISNSGDCEDFE